MEQKLRLSGAPIEEALPSVCWALVQFVFDRSGLSIRLASTKPSFWSAEAEGVLERWRQQFAEEIDLLERECTRLVHKTRSLSDPAFHRFLTRRLKRESVGQSRG